MALLGTLTGFITSCLIEKIRNIYPGTKPQRPLLHAYFFSLGTRTSVLGKTIIEKKNAPQEIRQQVLIHLQNKLE